MPNSIIIKNGGEGIYEEKKSRFIAKAYRVDTEKEANEYIEAARKKYWDPVWEFIIVLLLLPDILSEHY